MNNKNQTIGIIVFIVIVLTGLAVVYFDAKTHKEAPTPNGSQEEGVSFSRSGNIVRNNPGLKPNTWYLLYEESGSPALLVELEFTPFSVCKNSQITTLCSDYGFNQGDVVEVKGVQKGEKVKVVDLTFFNGNLPTKQIPLQLFYYNIKKDKELSGSDNILCSSEAVLPVDRKIDVSKTPIQDTINLLVQGQLTEEERQAGFVTEFPNKDFKLLGANLNGGTLTLEFTEVPGFTTGGSCRIGILTSQIIKTAKQFPEVSEVKFLPEEIFQP